MGRHLVVTRASRVFLWGFGVRAIGVLADEVDEARNRAHLQELRGSRKRRSPERLPLPSSRRKRSSSS
jgi:hypothetical protein